jgi:hypothetical protein
VNTTARCDKPSDRVAHVLTSISDLGLTSPLSAIQSLMKQPSIINRNQEELKALLLQSNADILLSILEVGCTHPYMIPFFFHLAVQTSKALKNEEVNKEGKKQYDKRTSCFDNASS